ncbi:sigma-70 family RNA polymerase sigma factor [Chenggangzhangella methanolivorans]|uniref:Sigma-70 family RNA polymerase sigma factor n=1 Tax=Chenggangzhangella methanolivorans TaxID=1437009 RepID=A0A9E6URC0_9HYPH|nr:sigma-70 family RNA polymerase sigma factor [Chenggangzhangella methanolivorans]QZO02105.1 sigma-70 family RNA polymerase sigma factor [Chenggangzhangella methanolivorans]
MIGGKAAESDWIAWMKAGIAGDAAAYERLLAALAPFIRSVARSRASAWGFGSADVEDVVQETLLAIHLKRGTWDEGQPVGRWAAAIARNKIIDALRRRGRRIHVPIDDFAETLPTEPEDEGLRPDEASRLISVLKGKQHAVVKAISIDGKEIRETAKDLDMSEGAVRVALHRGLSALADAYRSFRK